jgi:hypothetical protein
MFGFTATKTAHFKAINCEREHAVLTSHQTCICQPNYLQSILIKLVGCHPVEFIMPLNKNRDNNIQNLMYSINQAVSFLLGHLSAKLCFDRCDDMEKKGGNKNINHDLVAG